MRRSILPAISDQVTVVLDESQQTRTAVGLLATTTPVRRSRTAGTDGAPIALEALAPRRTRWWSMRRRRPRWG
ncbi:MAG: hypothetical protein U0232_15765 [Thermomicrobiales bacterium]